MSLINGIYITVKTDYKNDFPLSRNSRIFLLINEISRKLSKSKFNLIGTLQQQIVHEFLNEYPSIASGKFWHDLDIQ